MHFFCQSSNATEDQQNNQTFNTGEEAKEEDVTNFDEELESKTEICSFRSGDEATDLSGQYCELYEEASVVENDGPDTNSEFVSPQGKLHANKYIIVAKLLVR